MPKGGSEWSEEFSIIAEIQSSPFCGKTRQIYYVNIANDMVIVLLEAL